MEENRRELIEAIETENDNVLSIWQGLSNNEKKQNFDLIYNILKYIAQTDKFENEEKDDILSDFFNDDLFEEEFNRIEFIKILTLLNIELNEDEFINFNDEENQYESIKTAIEFLKDLDINKEAEYMNELLDKMLQNDIPGKEEHIYNLLAITNNNSIELSENFEDYIEKNKSDIKLMIIAFSKIKTDEIENSNILDIFRELKEKKNEDFIKNIDNIINDIDLDLYGEDTFIFITDLINDQIKGNATESEIFEKCIMQICYYDRENWKKVNEEKKENVEKYALDYINNLFKEKNPRELMKNKTVHVFLESFKQGDLTTIDPNKIKELLDNIEIPDMTEFDSLIDEDKDVPSEKLDTFFDGISAIKLKNGRIPEKYYKYVIKKVFLNEISKEKYHDIIEQSIIDMTYDYLKENNINNCIVSFGEQNKNSEKNVMGYYQDLNKIIFYSNADFAYSPVMSNLNTAFHESTHAIQYKFLENSENNSNIVLNNKMYRILKENIIRKIDKTFSDDNYEKMDLEFDARVQGAIKTNEFLLKLGFSEKEIAILSDMELKKTLKYEIEKNSYRKEKMYGGKKVSVDEIILEKLNERDNYLELYPILKLEFKRNENGTIERKNVSELKEDYERQIKELEKINDYEQIKNLNSIYKDLLGKDFNYEVENDIDNILLKIKNGEELSEKEYLIVLLNEEQIESVNELDLSIFMNNERETFQKIFDKQKSIYNKIKIYENARKNNIKLDLKEINLNDVINHIENNENKHSFLEEEFLLKAFIKKDEKEQIDMCDVVFETLLKRGEGIHFIDSISQETKERKVEDIINIALKTNSYNIKNLLMYISSIDCKYLYNHYDEFIKKLFMEDSELCRELCEDVIYVKDILDNGYFRNESAELPKIDTILSYHEKDKVQNLAKAHKMGIKIDIESLDINEVTESIKNLENTEQIKNCMSLFKDMLPYVDDKEKSSKIFNLFETICKNERIDSSDRESFLFKTLGMFNNQGFEENVKKIVDTIVQTDSFESYYCKNILEEISILDCDYLNNHYDKFVEKIFLQDTEKCKDMRRDMSFTQSILENGKNRNNNIELPNFLEIFMYNFQSQTKKENDETRWEESLKETYEKHSAEERAEAVEGIKSSIEKSKKERLENIEI